MSHFAHPSEQIAMNSFIHLVTLIICPNYFANISYATHTLFVHKLIPGDRISVYVTQQLTSSRGQRLANHLHHCSTNHPRSVQAQAKPKNFTILGFPLVCIL